VIVNQAATSSVRFLLVVLCVWGLVCAPGCSKKPVRRQIPFDLDKLLPVKPVPVTDENWREKGIRLAKEKKYKKAIEAFQSYILEDPEDYFGFNALAVCYKNSGDFSGAMKNYDRALELATLAEEESKILANIGNLYFSADKPQAALGFYKEAHERFKRNPLYLIFIARTFVVLQDYERARKVLGQAEEIESRLSRYERDDDRGLGDYLMAYSYLALNEEDKVYKYLEKAIKANPKRFVKRVRRDLSDEKSLLFTLKGDPKLSKILNKYSLKSFFEAIFRH
jgi:tetratricopeptide (TPR) repeat protein